MIDFLYPHMSIIGAAYLFVTLILGLQLTCNAFLLRPTTLISRVTGAAMLMDCAETVARIVANNCGWAGNPSFVLLSHVWDLLITLTLLGIGEVLHSGRFFPKRMALVAFLCAAAQILLSLCVSTFWAQMATLVMVMVLCALFVRQTIVIIRHDRQLVNLYSDIEPRRGGWYVLVCVFFIVEMLLWYVLHYLQFSDTEASLAYSLLMILFWVFLARNVATRVPLSPEVEQLVEIEEQQEQTDTVRRESLLTEGQLEKLKAQLELLMTEKHMFLDSDLDIQKVAKHLQSNRRYISYVLNHGMNLTFNEYVNRYRIEKVKRLIETTDMKLAAIAYDSGFNSPASMSRTFRALEGLSPQEWRRKGAPAAQTRGRFAPTRD